MKNVSTKARTISIEVYIPRQWKDHSQESVCLVSPRRHSSLLVSVLLRLLKIYPYSIGIFYAFFIIFREHIVMRKTLFTSFENCNEGT